MLCYALQNEFLNKILRSIYKTLNKNKFSIFNEKTFKLDLCENFSNYPKPTNIPLVVNVFLIL